MAETGRTQVVIHGRTYHLAGADPEHTRAIAREVDEAIARFADALPGVERYQLAILAALHLADEFLRSRQELTAFRNGIDASVQRILQGIESANQQDGAHEEDQGPATSPHELPSDADVARMPVDGHEASPAQSD